jgi:Rrf2 family protein
MLTRAADYAVRAVVHLASVDAGVRIALQDLSAAIGAPPVFVGKILQQLGAAGLVASRRGKHGGFVLTDSGRDATMFDVIVAIEGSPSLNTCLDPATRCPRAACCAAHRVWGAAQAQVVGILKAARISTLVSESARLAAAQPAEQPLAWAAADSTST